MRQQKTFQMKRVGAVLPSLVMIAMLSALSLSTYSRAATQENPTTPMTVILVRHAEKMVVPPENKDPDISLEGEKRAAELAKMFADAGIGAIFVSQYKRTQQTVKPLADKLGIAAMPIQAQKTPELIKQIRAQKPGQVVLVAGHNNTVPEVIAALGGPKLPIIPETQYDNLYILTVNGDGSAKLLRLKYGNSLAVAGQGMMSPP
ncbi:MAG TPA: phosphoglycerate mutase family protein [Pyrinomonadaceae bacterium]|nr:phosphoglycerate mutase family protein [Pyrinomonadaceae bacterium]